MPQWAKYLAAAAAGYMIARQLQSCDCETGR